MARSLIALSFALVAVANSGCVLEPLNEGEIRNHVTNVRGYFPHPSEDIFVEAWNWQTQRWDTIGHAQSAPWFWGIRTGFAPFPGSDSFYYWGTTVVVPANYFWRGDQIISGRRVDPDDLRRPYCVLRAIHRDGQVLASYDEMPDLGADPVQEWMQHGSPDAWFIVYDSN
jgi:hypothetical protein